MGFIRSYFKYGFGFAKFALVFVGLLVIALSLFGAEEFLEDEAFEGIPAIVVLLSVGIGSLVIGIILIIFTGSKGISLDFGGGRSR
jgi:uncharacterized membrane protein